MKTLTERQYQRREKILGTARDLITRHGYDGVTMRALAAKSGVTPKTLYDQFGSKEKLLRIAIEERFRHTYQAIDDFEVKNGIDKLFFIVDAVADSTRKNMAYALALAPVLSSRLADPFTSIRLNTYRKAVLKISAEGEFEDWVDVDVISSAVYRHISPVYANSIADGVAGHAEDMTKFDISLMLASITTGYTNKKVLRTIKSLQKSLGQRERA